MRGVVTLTEDYETRFLCFSPQVSPGIAVSPPPRPGLPSLPVPAQLGLWPPPAGSDAKSPGSKDGLLPNPTLKLCDKPVKRKGASELQLQRQGKAGSIEPTSLYRNPFGLGRDPNLPLLL